MQKPKEKAWEVISSRYLSEKPWFTVRCEHLKIPNGREIPEYFILEYPEWVNTIAITKDGEFVMVSQYRPAAGKSSYELCAGVCDDTDPDTLYSAQRELLEETGYSGGSWQKLMSISANPATHTNMTHCYLAVGVEKIQEQSLDPTEELGVHLFSAEQVKELLLSGEIIQALNAAPLWCYFSEYEKQL